METRSPIDEVVDKNVVLVSVKNVGEGIGVIGLCIELMEVNHLFNGNGHIFETRYVDLSRTDRRLGSARPVADRSIWQELDLSRTNVRHRHVVMEDLDHLVSIGRRPQPLVGLRMLGFDKPSTQYDLVIVPAVGEHRRMSHVEPIARPAPGNEAVIMMKAMAVVMAMFGILLLLLAGLCDDHLSGHACVITADVVLGSWLGEQYGAGVFVGQHSPSIEVVCVRGKRLRRMSVRIEVAPYHITPRRNGDRRESVVSDLNNDSLRHDHLSLF